MRFYKASANILLESARGGVPDSPSAREILASAGY